MDSNPQGLQTAFEQDGSYSVNYGNKEKFAINKKDTQTEEEKELELALEQIRQLEE